MFICYKTSTLNISKQRFWEHILRRVAILEAEQTQGSIPMIFLNTFIYLSDSLEQIWTFRKTLVIIRGLSYGIRELHDRTLKDHTGNNRSKSWFFFLMNPKYRNFWWIQDTIYICGKNSFREQPHGSLDDFLANTSITTSPCHLKIIWKKKSRGAWFFHIYKFSYLAIIRL